MTPTAATPAVRNTASMISVTIAASGPMLIMDVPYWANLVISAKSAAIRLGFSPAQAADERGFELPAGTVLPAIPIPPNTKVFINGPAGTYVSGLVVPMPPACTRCGA